MSSQLISARQILEEFLLLKSSGQCPAVDRPQIVAHATLSGWVDHWPASVDLATMDLLASTLEIKNVEHSRWMTQRRIAIAKLARELA